MDGGRSEDVNALQRRGDLAANSDSATTVGRITFLRASGPVGGDGRPLVLYQGTRGSIAAFNINHFNHVCGCVLGVTHRLEEKAQEDALQNFAAIAGQLQHQAQDLPASAQKKTLFFLLVFLLVCF